MEFIKTVALRGANRWASHSVIEAHFDGGAWARRSPSRWPELVAALHALRGSFEQVVAQSSLLARQHDAVPQDLVERFFAKLAHDGPLAQLLAQLARLFQLGAGVWGDEACVEETDEPGVAIIAFPFEEEPLGLACLDAARSCLLAAAESRPIDVATLARELVNLADDVRLGPSSLAIVRAAVARGIPLRRLNSGSLVQLGEGKKQRRIWTAETDATSAIAESIAQDKELTKRLLRAVGVPVPLGRPVTSPEDAWAAACEIGLPVVVKPRGANHARGISLDLSTREQVVAAYDWAVKDGENTGVLVEQYARGFAHRLLVVGNRLLAAARGESEHVVGDGTHTIAQLVDEVNRDPRRGENYTDLLNVLKLDSAALIELKKQGYEPESIPPAGERVLIQHVGDLTTDCTDEVHPINATKAVLAARVVGLDIAGLDVIASDIRQPLESQRGAVLEVNAGPSLSMHVAPLHGHPQPVGQAIIDHLFASDANGRIPLIGVTGDADCAAVACRLDELLQDGRRPVGRATSAGVFFQGQKTGAPIPNEADRFETLIVHPDVELALVELAPVAVAARGAGSNRLDLVVVTCCPAADLATGAVRDAVSAEIRSGIQAALRAVPRDGVAVMPFSLASDADLWQPLRGRALFFATSDVADALLQKVLARGAGVVLVSEGQIVLARSEGQETLRLPSSWPGSSSSLSIELAAIAAAWAAGQVAETIAARL